MFETNYTISSNFSSQYVCVPTVDRTDPSIPISIWVFIFFCSYFIEGWHCSKMDRLARRISQGPQGPIQFSVSKQIKEKSVPQFNILLNWWCSTSTILSTLYVSLIRVSESKPRYFFSFYDCMVVICTITNNCFYLKFWLSPLKIDCAIWIRKFDWSDTLKLMCIIVCPSINI